MSPASSGLLEVEKYIGACLISQHQGRPKTNSREVFYGRPGNFFSDRWAGGVPLISFANHQRRGRSEPEDQQKNPLARLAQGAPLILAKPHNRRNKKNDKGKTADAVSVTSDESSETGGLPRIIKPRKRRKKDKKPVADGFSTDSASTSPEVERPFLFEKHRIPEKKHDFSDISEIPKLHHRFEDVEEIDDSLDINGNESMCQCRYCDPTGQIWDADRNCYSPFLTRPSKTDCRLVDGLASISLEDDKGKNRNFPSSGDLEVSTTIVTSLNGHRDIEIKFFST